jgi:hypothetical protein
LIAGKLWGIQGVACVYAFSQLCMTPLYIHFINKRYLKQGRTSLFLFKNILIPIIFLGFISYTLSYIPVFDNRILDLFRIVIILVITMLPLVVYLYKLKK